VYALRLRWLWFQHTDGDRPWNGLELDFGNDLVVQKMFQASIDVLLGAVTLALFWTDRWNGEFSPCVAAPAVCAIVRRGVQRRRTVAEALENRQWIKDLIGQLTLEALHQYINLWHSLRNVELQPMVEDKISWRWSPTANYSARSAYRSFVEGSTRFAGVRPIWRSWAPFKVKFFAWLAVHKRLWTADRRHHHGLQAHTECILCDQEPESTDHLFVSCSFSKQVWHTILSALNFTMPADAGGLLHWWLLLRNGHSKLKQKGLDSIVMLVTWTVWKERKKWIFDDAPAKSPSVLVDNIWKEGELWVLAGARWMAALGWPYSTNRVAGFLQ
jgi:hypothetical protein